MRFMIHGADQKTGRELTIVVDAPDASEAERRAMYNDVLVSSVARFTAGAAGADQGQRPEVPLGLPLTYRPAEVPPGRRGATPPHPAAAVPGYREVVRGARWLDWIGLLARWGGCLAIVLGLCLATVAFVAPVRERLALPDRPVLYGAAGVASTALGLLCALCGVMVSMTSGLVIAVRDIAQNTFHVAAAKLAQPDPTGDDAPPAGRRTHDAAAVFLDARAVEHAPLPLPPPADDHAARSVAA